MKKTEFEEMKELAEKEGIPQDRLIAFIKYFDETLEWGPIRAVSHCLELFKNGTIHEIMKMGGTTK